MAPFGRCGKELLLLAFSPFADIEIESITLLSPRWFSDHGIRLMLLDFDNTIIAYKVSEPDEPFLKWLKETRDAGVQVMVVSNSRRSRRVPSFCEPLGIPWIRHAGKPNPKGIFRAMNQMGMGSHETAMAGDQTYTDILAANFAGVTSVLVKPIYFSNPFQRVRYYLELPFIIWGRKRRKSAGNSI